MYNNESHNERPNEWCFLQFYIPRGAESIGHFDTESSQAITLACSKKRFDFITQNLKKGPETPWASWLLLWIQLASTPA